MSVADIGSDKNSRMAFLSAARHYQRSAISACQPALGFYSKLLGLARTRSSRSLRNRKYKCRVTGVDGATLQTRESKEIAAQRENNQMRHPREEIRQASEDWPISLICTRAKQTKTKDTTTFTWHFISPDPSVKLLWS